MYYNIPYKHTFPGTNLHWITFLIIIIEALIFFYQLINWLSRPTDKTRFWYLVFVFLMLIYNISGGLFVDANLPIPIEIQLYIEVFVAILVTIYFAIYLYNGLNIKELKFLTWKGSFYFLIIPFFMVFVPLSKVIGDVKIALIIYVAIICSYGVYCLFRLYKNLYNTLKDRTVDRLFKERYVGVTITITFWIFCMSSFSFYNVNQYTEHMIINLGFLIMSYIFIRQSIVESRKEYFELQNINEMLVQKVNERTKELEIANDLRINSFINLAHEMRTPITLIKNYLDEFISKHKESEEIKIIKVNIDKLNKDIVNYFNEEMLIKGLAPQYNHNQIVDFSNHLNHKLLLFKQYAQKRSIELSLQIENSIHIKADPETIDSIVNNLIENAIKYTPMNGTINITLKDDKDYVLFSVKDSGYGIPENMHQKIFEPYVRMLTVKKNMPGMGMGLFIVKNIVTSLNGEIILQSKENEGTEFTVKLHRYFPEPGESIIESNINNSAIYSFEEPNIEDAIDNKNKATVFIIEDNYEMLRYLRNKLKESFNVYVAPNGRKALEKLKHIPKPDLFISDIMMDEMDGFKLLKIITDNPNYSHIPFIFLTAKTTTIDKIQGLTMGAIDYIHKPFSINELLKKVESIIKTTQKQKENILQTAIEVITNKLGLPVEANGSKNEKLEQNCKNFNITLREKEIVVYIAEGLTYKEISDKLNISEKTVVKHRQNIFSKVNVSSKIDLLNRLFES